jgi:hypothetical protein
MTADKGATASGEVLELMMSEGHFDKIRKEVCLLPLGPYIAPK